MNRGGSRKPNEAQWKVVSNGVVPSHALRADSGSNLLVARGTYNGTLIPGKYDMTTKKCYVPWGGRAVSIEEFEVLVDPKSKKTFQWVSPNEARNPVWAGRAESGEYYVGRAKHQGAWIPGKVHKDKRLVFYFPCELEELSSASYEVLNRVG